MRIPENGRLFVGGITPSTGDADLRYHFSLYGRALADPHHVINGRKVYVGRAEPRQSQTLNNRMPQYKPLCQRVIRADTSYYRVGDMATTTLGPLPDGSENSEYVNRLRKFAVLRNKTLIFKVIIAYISEDCKTCWVRWLPVQRDDESATSMQGYINPVRLSSCVDPTLFTSSGNIASSGFVGEASPSYCQYCQGLLIPNAAFTHPTYSA
ncbi:hypothetical protein ACP70R_035890 [Stipagrostis hirtigluma subsp. patula]